MKTFLEGKKTYIVGAIMVILAIAKGQGWINSDTYAEVTGIMVGLGLWTLRVGMNGKK